MSEVAQVPQLRFPEFSGNWESKIFRDVFERITTKNKENNENVLTISAQQGLINQKDYFNKSVSAKDVTGYYLLHKDDFAYNKSYSQGYPLGAIKRLKKYDKGVVSTLYICFKSIQDNIDFLEQVFNGGRLNHEIHKIAQEGARNHGLLNISVVEFFKDIKLNIPTKPEQQKIAAFLAAVDSKIEQLSKKQALLGEYKKGLMQQIFSQAIRFKADDGSEFPDWEDNTIDKALHSYKLGGNYSNSEAVTDYPLIKMGNLDRGNIKLNKLQYINTEENIDDSDKINYGDLFFNTRNTLDLVGKVAIWRDELPCAYYNSNLMKMEFSDNFFMNYRFNSFDGIKALRRVATGTTSVAAIYTKDLLKIKFSLPTLSEQQKIANFLSSIDTKIEQAGKQLDESKQFKKALLQQMFV